MYRFLALGFSYPSPELSETARGALRIFDEHGLFDFSFGLALASAVDEVAASAVDGLEVAYIALFEAGPGGAVCSPFESGHLGDPRQVPEIRSTLRRTYLRFGIALDVGPDLADHIATELEVMALLCRREAATRPRLPGRVLEHQRELIGDHLGRWVPSFGRSVVAADRHPAYGCLADALTAFVQHEHQWITQLVTAEAE